MFKVLLMYAGKLLWHLYHMIHSNCLLLFYKALPGVFFSSVGSQTVFYGAVRFGTVGNNNISLGRQCMIGKYVFMSAGKNCQISLGDKVSINTGGHLVALYGITIGSGTRIGEFVSIRDQNHVIGSMSNFSGKEIHIGHDVWIGRGCVILPGVTIGNYAVIGANSVVNHDIPDSVMAAGSPAVVKKRLNVGMKSDLTA